MTDVNSLSSASAVPAHEISSTDEDLASQMSTLCNIDPRTNSISFIDRLPIETLEAIFIHTACSYFRKDDGLPIPTPPTWVSVSYVCSHWRNVALSSPTLWSYLFVTSPRWTEELLSRSKQAPLKLHMTSYRSDKTSTSRALRFLEQVVNYAERIQEIRLYLPLWLTRKTLQFFSKLFSNAPLLQYVIIAARATPEYWVPSILFDGDTPVLRTMELWNLPVPWYSLKLSSLTTLSLHCVHGRFRQTRRSS
ncbi:hypothetical protein V8E55_001424 [Tylopilus felleus]